MSQLKLKGHRDYGPISFVIAWLFLATSVAAVLLVTGRSLSELTNRHNLWLVLGFFTYVFAIVVFACIYLVLHLRNPDAFLFARDVVHSQRLHATTSSTRTIEDLVAYAKPISAFIELSENNFASVTPDRGGVVFLPSGCKVVFGYTFISDPQGGGDSMREVSVIDSQGVKLGSQVLPGAEATTREEYRDVAAQSLREVCTRLGQEMTRLNAIASGSGHLWSIWDFLYFSTITQSTVGYGDILPNRTGIRIIVMLQILTGYAIIVVMINMLFR